MSEMTEQEQINWLVEQVMELLQRVAELEARLPAPC